MHTESQRDAISDSPHAPKTPIESHRDDISDTVDQYAVPMALISLCDNHMLSEMPFLRNSTQCVTI